ncbi:unnamed protein product [Mytilus coruscus]|uniref:Uncharacterized protein n=1 Tax=Mytilus coruscus TaxID=42192 RepID=A0A6J8E6Q8_MYTCO|nr:unnamed protein product [Mytilus coruscus]
MYQRNTKGHIGVTSHNHIIEDNNNKKQICRRNESLLDSECSTDKAKLQVPKIPKNVNLDFTAQVELEITYTKGQIREVHDCSFNHTETFDDIKYFEVISFYKELKGFLLYLSVLSWYTRCLFEKEVLNGSDSKADQQRPERQRMIHVEPEASLDNFVYDVDDEDIDDSHECGRCKKKFKSLDSFMNHKISCKVKRTEKKITRAHVDPEDLTTQFRHTFSTDNEQFMNDILKMIKENADKLTTRNISNDFYEKGSLVFWGKMDRSVTKDRESVKKCMEAFVAKMFEKCPPNSDKETKCTIKLDIVKEIEGCEDDEEDIFSCGRCKKLFNRIDVFSSHKKECNRRARILRTSRETVLREEEKPQTVQAQCILKKQDRVIKADLDDNQKRWLLVGICIQSILSPIFRKFTEPVVLNLYNSMKLSHNIDTQTYPNQLKKYPNSRGQLNYEAINKNHYITRIGKKPDVVKYDYRYTAFDETCDMSVILSLIVSIGTFPQSVKNVAMKFRSDVRNLWAHCDFDEWDTVTYQRSFQLMHQLIKCLNLNETDTKHVLEDLTKWETNGFMFLQGYAVDQHVVSEITQHTQVLAENAVKMKSGQDSTYIKVHEALLRINGKMDSVCKRIDAIERNQNEQLKALQEMNKGVTIFSERPSAIKKAKPEHGQRLGTITNIQDITLGADKLKTEYTSIINIVEKFAGDVKETTEDLSIIKSDITKIKMDIGGFKIYMSKSKPTGKIFFYPPNRSESFIVREREMSQIKSSFVDKGNSTQTLVISGIGGCGKTTLAAEFAWRSQEFYDGGIFWMSAESESSLWDSVTKLAIDVSTSGKDFRETFKRTINWFSKLTQRWLLVVDNADEEYLSDYTKELMVGKWKNEYLWTHHHYYETRNKRD